MGILLPTSDVGLIFTRLHRSALLIMTPTLTLLLLKTSLKLDVQQTTKVVETLLENDTLTIY